MTLSNPKKFSWRLGLAVAVGVAAATFVSLCFDFGNGRLPDGMNSAFRYVTFIPWFFGFIVMAGLGGGVAVLVGRVVGVAAAGGAAFLMLAVSTVVSAISSEPKMRFRKIVWAGAPDSIQILKHQRFTSFSDGTTSSFIVATDSNSTKRWIHDCRLERVAGYGNEESLLLAYFSEAGWPTDVAVYRSKSVVVAYLTSQDKAWVVCRPGRVP